MVGQMGQMKEVDKKPIMESYKAPRGTWRSHTGGQCWRGTESKKYFPCTLWHPTKTSRTHRILVILEPVT